MSSVPTAAAPALGPLQLDAYLRRIGLSRPADTDLAALTAIHRAHLASFTWEALDAFMGWPSTTDPGDAFAKMVEGRRGGWCYEMNGLLGAALAAMGFRVTRLCGAVDRHRLGDVAVGNHLTLRVDLDQPYLVEAGLGDAPVAPLPMAPGATRERGFDFALTTPEEGWLRFENHPRGLARSFDFRPAGRDEAAMAAAHRWLSEDPGSPFTGTLAMFRHTTDGYVALQGDRLRRVTADGAEERLLGTAGELGDAMQAAFGILVPDPRPVWDKVAASRDRRDAA